MNITKYLAGLKSPSFFGGKRSFAKVLWSVLLAWLLSVGTPTPHSLSHTSLAFRTNNLNYCRTTSHSVTHSLTHHHVVFCCWKVASPPCSCHVFCFGLQCKCFPWWKVSPTTMTWSSFYAKWSHNNMQNVSLTFSSLAGSNLVSLEWSWVQQCYPVDQGWWMLGRFGFHHYVSKHEGQRCHHQ